MIFVKKILTPHQDSAFNTQIISEHLRNYVLLRILLDKMFNLGYTLVFWCQKVLLIILKHNLKINIFSNKIMCLQQIYFRLLMQETTLGGRF